jgi:hypothetical protein
VVLGEYKVTYNANGGNGHAPVDRTAYVSGTLAPVLGSSDTDLKKSGYILTGWLDDDSGEQYEPGGKLKIKKDTTLFAIWKTPEEGIVYGGGIIFYVDKQKVYIVTLEDLEASTWRKAQENCKNYSITIGGVSYKHWRLPDVVKLNNMYLFAKPAAHGYTDACNIEKRGNFCTGSGPNPKIYWSSSVFGDDEFTYSWYAQDFSLGKQMGCQYRTNRSVRAIRTVDYK